MLNIDKHLETITATLSELKAYMSATGDVHGYHEDLSVLITNLMDLKDELEKKK